jgi:hypothetical protein
MSRSDQFWQYAKEAMLSACYAKPAGGGAKLDEVCWAGSGYPMTSSTQPVGLHPHR